MHDKDNHEHAKTSKKHVRGSIIASDVVAMAIALADSGGITGMSMRKIAAALGIGTMTVYEYATNKDELLDLMLDVIYKDIASAADGRTGHDALIEICKATRKTLLNHPWAIEVSGRHPSIGPHSLAKLEATLKALREQNSTNNDYLLMNGFIEAYIYGFVMRELASINYANTHKRTKAEWQDAQRKYMREAIESGRYPLIARYVVGQKPTDSKNEARFELGLIKIIDSHTPVGA